jgi:hypothetical protein
MARLHCLRQSELPRLPPSPPEHRLPDGGACGNDARAEPRAGCRAVIFDFGALARFGRAPGAALSSLTLVRTHALGFR